MIFSFRKNMFKAWYWYVSKVDKNAEVLFMNYGYSDDNQKIILDEKDEPNRYPIQLYHHLADAVTLKNKDIIEIGSGRGGGLAYIAKRFSPATAIGIDLSKKAVSFCKRHYKQKGLSFLQGDAEKISLDAGSCDVVINVESSHRYSSMKVFLGEVHRILRRNGHFLLTDFREDAEMTELRNDLKTSGLIFVSEKIINKQVVEALEADELRRRSLVRQLTPRLMHRTALNFAAVQGSETYRKFASSEYVYFSFVLRKP